MPSNFQKKKEQKMAQIGQQRRKSRHVKIDIGSEDESISSIESSGSINADLTYGESKSPDIFSLRKSKEKHAHTSMDWYFKDLANQPIEMSPQVFGSSRHSQRSNLEDSSILKKKSKSVNKE